MTGYLTVLLDRNDVADAHRRMVVVCRMIVVELIIKLFNSSLRRIAGFQRRSIDQIIVFTLYCLPDGSEPVHPFIANVTQFIGMLYLIDGKAISILGEKCLFSFLLMFLTLHDLFVELRAFLPFLTVHTAKTAMLHDLLWVKHHALRIVLMQHIDSQTGGIQFQRPFSGNREHPIIGVAVFQHIRCGDLLIRHGVFIQRLLLCLRQLGRSSHLTDLCLHLLIGRFLQGLDHGQRCVFYRVFAPIVVITNLENCLHAGKLRHIQLTAIHLFHGCSIVKGVVPAAVTGLDMKIGGIIDQKQSLLRVGVRPQHLHFRHGRSQFLYRFLYQRIVTIIVDCLNSVQVNGLPGQNRKRSFIVSSVFQLKTNSFDPVHSLCRNLLINADSFLQRQVIVVFSEVWKLHALCYIVG